jgi:hypothetical protein
MDLSTPRHLLLAAFIAILGLLPCPALPMTQLTETVAMTDGTGLATRVYLPDATGGAWPTLLIRTPYTMEGSFGDQLIQGLELITMRDSTSGRPTRVRLRRRSSPLHRDLPEDARPETRRALPSSSWLSRRWQPLPAPGTGMECAGLPAL